MQLLIVDDEHIIVEDLKTSLDWESLGITKVFEAYNIRMAKEIFVSESIDLMLCDIEMPQGSGLELLSWVKENYSQTESVFLTCHADFYYAKEAIRLGSLDYLLKPVPYNELEKVITRAVMKIRQNSKLLESSRYGEFWFKHQPLVVERFWYDIINRSISPDQKAILEAAEMRNIPYSVDMKFLPVLFGVRRWSSELSMHEIKVIEYEIKKVASNLILKEGSNGQIFELEKGKMILILSLWSGENVLPEILKDRCRDCIDVCNQSLKCDLSAHIGEGAYAHELPVIVDRLLEQERNNVAFDNRVFMPGELEKALHSFKLPSMDIWSIMLAEGAGEKLIEDIVKHLENQAVLDIFNANSLKYFKHDFIQMVYSTLRQRGIQAHELLGDDQSSRLYDHSSHSVKDLIIWIKHVITKAAGYTREMDQADTVVQKAQKYIGLNLEQELTREAVANYLYLNPDYLDRIFKKETGMSVTKFLIQERLEKAREMLEKTEMPIGDIALIFGYKNMSHFSTVFKKYTGHNPVDYRRSHIMNIQSK